MADVSALMASIPAGASLDPAQVEAANAATLALVNQSPAIPPDPFISPEDAAKLGVVFPAATLPQAQQAGAQFVAPPAAAPVPAAAPPPVSTPAPGAQAQLPPAQTAPGAGRLQVPDVARETQDIAAASQDTQAAIANQGAAQAAETDAEAQARQLGAERMGLQQEHLRETQRQRDDAIRSINQDQQRVYDEAHRATIPDFFESRPGTRALAAVSVGLSEAGRGLLAFGTGANVGNTANQIIGQKISEYYQQKRFEVDNLFKYAAARNQLGEQQKALWASKLNDLQFEMAATHQAMADHILEVSAASKGRVAQANAVVLAKQQAEQAQQLEQKARETNYNNQLSLKRVGIEAYNAGTARMSALREKQAQVEIRIGQQIDGDLGALEKRIAKPREALGKIDDIITQMDDAYKSKDPNRLAASIIALKEGVGPLFAGGKTTGNLTAQLDKMGTTKDEVQKALGKLTGGNTVGDTMFHRLREMAVIGRDEKAGGIGNDRQAYVRKYLGPGGLANTPEKKQRFLNDLNGITSEIKVGGQPLFQEGGAPPTPTPVAPTANNTQVKMRDGTIAEFDASGRRVK